MLIEKPWGSEELLEKNAAYMVKRLFMKKGHRCSLQYHEQKKETVYVLSGVLRILVGPSADALTDTLYHPGDSLTLTPGTVHRMEAVEDATYLEASTPEMDDVVRLSDDYRRN